MRAVVTAAILLTTVSARAANDVPTMRNDVSDYYNGERNSAFIAMGLGAAATGTGAYLLTRKTDFATGAGWPLVTIGALETIGAISYAIDVTGKKSHYLESLDKDPAAFQREEADHIHGTTSRFFIYRLVELGLTLGGAAVATYGFAANNDTWKGVGIALAAIGLPLLIMDTINNNRALTYQEKVKTFGTSVALPLGSQRTFGVSFGGSF
jgi:hypothetical protein